MSDTPTTVRPGEMLVWSSAQERPLPDGRARITIETEEGRVSLTFGHEGLCETIVDAARKALLALGYHPDSIKDALENVAEGECGC